MFPVDEIRFGIALSQIAGTRGVGIGVKEGCIQGDRLIESHVLIPRRGAEDGIQPVTNADFCEGPEGCLLGGVILHSVSSLHWSRGWGVFSLNLYISYYTCLSSEMSSNL